MPELPDLAEAVLFGPTLADPAVCREADAVVVALAQLAKPVSPSPEVRVRVLSMIAVEPRPFVRPAADGPWEDWLVPGLAGFCTSTSRIAG